MYLVGWIRRRCTWSDGYSVTYNWQGPQGTYQDPDYINVHVSGDNYPETSFEMEKVGGSDITAEYSYTVPAGEFQPTSFPAQYHYYFEGTQGDHELRYPNQTGATKSFTIIQENPSGLTLSLNPNPTILNQPVEVTAQLMPVISNYPINFFDDPYKGAFDAANPVLTDENGIATINYYPSSTGLVEIIAVDDENSSVWDMKSLTIQPLITDITIELSSARNGIHGNQVWYDIYAYVFNSSNPYSNFNITFQTDAGFWENNLQTYSFHSDSYNVNQILYFDCSKNTTAQLSVTVEDATQQYDLLIQCEIPPLEPTSIIQATGAETLSFHPNDDKIAFSKNDEKVYIYDVSSGEMVTSFTFIEPINGGPADIHMVRYSPDGTKLFLGSPLGSRIVNPSSGTSLSSNNSIRFYFSSENYGDACWIDNTTLLISSEDYNYNYVHGVFNSSLTPLQSLFDDQYLIFEVDASDSYAVVSMYPTGHGHLVDLCGDGYFCPGRSLCS